MIGNRWVRFSPADGVRRLGTDHGPADARRTGDALPLAGPPNGMALARAGCGSVRLAAIRGRCGHRASNQVRANIGGKDGWQVHGTDDLAVHVIEMDLERREVRRGDLPRLFRPFLLRFRSCHLTPPASIAVKCRTLPGPSRASRTPAVERRRGSG